MRHKQWTGVSLATLVVVLSLVSLGWGAPVEKVLFRFNSANGALPDYGPLVTDSAGDLYGTTDYGGGSTNCTYGCGTVYELKPGSSGAWTHKLLHSFTAVPDGSEPVAGLVRDSAGNLYGTTSYGGASTNCTTGCGTVFELSPTSTGWSERVLYSFKASGDGSIPSGPLTMDSSGNLYGTTYFGGSSTNCTTGCGTVFELRKLSTGQWSERVLYSFKGTPDGSNPWSVKLARDSAGNLYGTTYYGGNNTNCIYGCGTVFKVSPGSSGTWTEVVMHRFSMNSDGALPLQGVILDASGNVYGTTRYGGGTANYCTTGCGVVFKLSRTSTGGWAEAIVHRFKGSPDGANPFAALVLDSAGNLYGTTISGGSSLNCTAGCGTVYEVQYSGGKWTENILHSFTSVPDGALSSGQLILDSGGNLYGTTYYGGSNVYCTYGCGTVFEISGR